MPLRRLPAAVLLPALGLALTACADPTPAAAPHPAAPAALPHPPAATAATVIPVEAVRDGSGRCTADDLRATVSAPPGERATERIELTNLGPAPCTMTGYPQVDLLSDTGTWTLPRSPGSPVRTVTLPPGGTARVVIDYLPRGTGGRPEFKVTGIALTPPGGTGRLVFHWEGANPRAEDGAAVRPVAP
ncbi:hypothetical protein Kpho02_19080 [Kitasatospora phosalacinea]|uniref:DUF4232 domain-containing protein n=1 Tax=Kitasatospora phosalacinea TaxID=2065 RepID=A0A9W6Q6S6_9ACTN|nr:DUF4232 domain-containing protein [Kitasatospora phosalacinea]GLW69609.1 hypothetical protein Kpho02_19080 [Kitasatospora phosalacinea]